MKKLLFILAAMVAIFAANAQSTTPRWGSGPNNDNTGRVLTWNFKSITDAAGADSTTLVPGAYNTTVRLALTDSFFFKSPSVKQSFAADVLTIVASGASGTKVKFAGSNFISAGTATLSTLGRAVVTFIFDGAKWVEQSRVVQ